MNQLFYNVASQTVKQSWWRWCRVSFSVVFLFFCLNSSPREKVGKLSLFWDWWAESLFVSIIVAKYIVFPRANNGCSHEKKISGEVICSHNQGTLLGFWACLRVLNLIARLWYKKTSGGLDVHLLFTRAEQSPVGKKKKPPFFTYPSFFPFFLLSFIFTLFMLNCFFFLDIDLYTL